MSARLLMLLLALLLAGGAAAQAKKRVEKAADLPRFSYKLDGRIEDMVRDDAKFKPFAGEVRRDLESVLAQYDIEDKATLRQILGELAQLDMLDGNYEAAMAHVAQVKALEDKPADKLLSGDHRAGNRRRRARESGPDFGCVSGRGRSVDQRRAGGHALWRDRQRGEGDQGRRRDARRRPSDRQRPRGAAALRRQERLTLVRPRARARAHQVHVPLHPAP